MTSLLWLVNSHMPEPASLNSSQVGSVVFSALKYHHFYHDYKHRLYKCATWWFSVEQENLGKLLLAGTLAFLTLKAFYMHKNRYNTLTGREEMKMPWQASSILCRPSSVKEEILFPTTARQYFPFSPLNPAQSKASLTFNQKNLW